MRNQLTINGVDLCAHFGGMINAMEIYFVIRGIKPATRVFISDLEKTGVLSKIDDRIRCVVADFVCQFETEKSKNGYSNKFRSHQIRDGDIPEGYTCPIYISLNEDMANEAKRADGENSAYLGLLFGYPECCIDFYRRNSPKLSKTSNDFVLESLSGNDYLSSASFMMNYAVRYYDYSLLSHFSCSLHCHDSLAIAKERYKMIRNEYPGFAKEMCYRLSSMVLYSEKHGIFYTPEYEIMDNNIAAVKYRGFIGVEGAFLKKLRNCNELRVERNDHLVLLSDGTALPDVDAVMCYS